MAILLLGESSFPYYKQLFSQQISYILNSSLRNANTIISESGYPSNAG